MSGKHGAVRRAFGPIAFAIAGVVILPFAVTASSAGWTDVEHDNGTLASVDCSAGTGYASAARGQLVGGSVLGLDLDAVAAVTGAIATNGGTDSSTEVANPLNVLALGSINPQLGTAFQLDAGAQTGAVQQYARATSWGYSAGAAGSVADSGGIDLQAPTPGSPVPKFATLGLGDVLDAVTHSGLGGGISGLADVRLALGALASYATLDGCNADWENDVAANLDRDYLIAGLSAELDSPLVAAVSSTTTTGLTNIDALVAAVAGDSGLVNSITTSTLGALTSTLSAFVKGTPTTTISLDVDFTAVTSLLTNPIADSGGILSIDLGGGTITVDLARLLGPSYENSVGLNGLAPNTELLVNDAALNALATAVDAALISWIGQVTTAINAAMGVLTVDVQVSVPISVGVPILGLTIPVGSVVVSITDASLAALAAGTAPISTTVALGGACPGAGVIACGVINPLLTTLTTAVSNLVLKGVLGPVIATTITTALSTVPGLATLLTNLATVRTSLVGFLGTSLRGLFGPDAVLSLVVNAQDTLAPPGTDPFRTGQYSVAALRLVTLGLLSGGVAVDLAKSTVGQNGPA